MRSKASHFTGLVKFLVFVMAVILLVYAVVQWAKQRQHTPKSTSSSQTSDNKSVSDDSKTKSNSKSSGSDTKSTSRASNGKSPSSSAPTKSTGSSAARTSQALGSSGASSQSVVPNAGLDITQALVGASGVSLSCFMAFMLFRSKRWQELD